MCGIVYAHDFEGNSVNNGVLDLFDAQRNRGLQGFGLFDGQEGNIVRHTTEDGILKWLCKYDSNLLLFHHRYPTSTANTKNTAHPFTTGDYFGDTEYILVHNGHINNAYSLKQAHQELGISYRSIEGYKFNDSEALAWDMALYLEGKQSSLEAVGAIAFVCIKLVNGELDKLFFGRNTNPLNMHRVPNGLVLSSQGLGNSIDPHQLYTWNYKLKRLTTKYLFMAVSSYSGYSYSAPVRDSRAERYPTPTENFGEWSPDEDQWFDELSAADQKAVDELLMRYLNHNKGNLERTYNDLEFDYMQISEDVQTAEEYQQMRIYEAAMLDIETDPEWLNPFSVSSKWKQLTLIGG